MRNIRENDLVEISDDLVKTLSFYRRYGRKHRFDITRLCRRLDRIVRYLRMIVREPVNDFMTSLSEFFGRHVDLLLVLKNSSYNCELSKMYLTRLRVFIALEVPVSVVLRCLILHKTCLFLL
jgi:hypothetical protein